MNKDSITRRPYEPTKYDLLEAMRQALSDPFTRLQSWGWSPAETTSPAEREAFRQDRERTIQTYLDTLPESRKAILSDYLTERRALIERHASPLGFWYLFTLREARSMFASERYAALSSEDFLGTTVPDSEKEWFARRFLEKWSTEGERLFSLEEWEELQFVRREEYESKDITPTFGRPPQYTWKHEFDFYLETWYQIFNRYGTLFESGLQVNLKEKSELFRDYQEIRRVVEYFLTTKQGTRMNSEVVEEHFRQFERSIGYECDRLSRIEWAQVKEFADTIGDPLERVGFLKRIAELPDDGVRNSSIIREQCPDGRLLHRRNQEDVINPVNSERRRLLSERFDFDTIAQEAREIRDDRKRLRYLTQELELFGDYNPSIRSGAIEHHLQQFYFGIRDKIKAAERLVLTAEPTENAPVPPAMENRILQGSPRIFEDLSGESRYDEIRQFLSGLKRENDKLIWPNHPHRSEVPKPERIRKYDLPLLLHHLVQKEGLSESYSSHSFVTTLFLWNNHSDIQAKELRKMLNESNDRVENLPPGIVTDMIRRLYSD